jgi:hypothetical protein
MSLTVTVQKGHDFSSGNITRAALNSGATPTVAVTGSVGSSEISDGAIIEAKIAAGAVTSTKLASHASSDSSRAVTTDHIKDDAVTLAKIADASIVKENLIINKNADGNSNIIDGLGALDSVEVDDYVMVHDTSVTANGTAQLKKAKVSTIQKVGTTEYSHATKSDPNGPQLGTEDSDGDITTTIDLDGAPFQTLSTDPPAGGVTKDYNFVLTNSASTGSVKTVSIRIVGPSSGQANFTWPSWNWPERTDGPGSIPNGKVALLSITDFGGGDIVAAYVVTT